jgi:hypothetical protein
MQRLGVSQHGMSGLRQHAFFRGVRWDQIEAGTHAPPRELVDLIGAFAGLENAPIALGAAPPGADLTWIDRF